MTIYLHKALRSKIILIKKAIGLGVIFLFTLSLLTGCSSYSKDNYLENFSAFITKVETSYTNFTNEDWKLNDSEYQRYIGEEYQQYKDKLTPEDHKSIGKFKTKYQVIKTKYNASKIINKVGEGINQLEGIIEGVTESISNP